MLAYSSSSSSSSSGGRGSVMLLASAAAAALKHVYTSDATWPRGMHVSGSQGYALLFLLNEMCLCKGDSLRVHLGQQFSTRDQDNDLHSASCAVAYKGAWWYERCHDSNLNGLYLNGSHSSYADGVGWNSWKGRYYSLIFTEMKIRPF